MSKGTGKKRRMIVMCGIPAELRTPDDECPTSAESVPNNTPLERNGKE